MYAKRVRNEAQNISRAAVTKLRTIIDACIARTRYKWAIVEWMNASNSTHQKETRSKNFAALFIIHLVFHYYYALLLSGNAKSCRRQLDK